MKIKRVITNIERYLTKEEAKGIYNALLLNRELEKENLKIHKITNKAYMIELKDIETELKNKIKKDIEVIDCTVYKTNDTLKDLRQRQENRELVQELQQEKQRQIEEAQREAEREAILKDIEELDRLTANEGEAI